MSYYYLLLIWPAVTVGMWARLGFLFGLLDTSDFKKRFHAKNKQGEYLGIDEIHFVIPVAWPLVYVLMSPVFLGSFLKKRKERLSLPEAKVVT